MKRIALPLALVFACGDDGSTTKTPDAGDTPDATPIAPFVVVVAGDFGMGTPGVLSTIDTTARTVMTNRAPQGSISSDPLVRKFGDELFVVNRTENNITILDATTFALVEQLATGAGSNPQDVAVDGSKLFVPTLAGKGVLVLTRGQTATQEIDLSVDDPDGAPNCNSIYKVDGKLYVSCGLLDAMFSPRGNAKLYAIDAATGQRAETVTLSTKNPIALIERDPAAYDGDLLIATVDFATGNGCVERVTPGAMPVQNGCAVMNAALGGFVNRIAFAADHTLLLAVNGMFPAANLQSINASGAPTIISPPAQHITDVIACNDLVVVSDQTDGAKGVRIYDGSTELTSAPLDVGLPPSSAHGLLCN